MTAADPSNAALDSAAPMRTGEAPILEVRGLRTWFFADEGIVRAVDGVSFDVRRGETVGLVGESGSGKSITGLSIMQLLDDPGRIVGGSILFGGRDIVTLGGGE